jgi:acyl-CoA thioester hydrolase
MAAARLRTRRRPSNAPSLAAARLRGVGPAGEPPRRGGGGRRTGRSSRDSAADRSTRGVFAAASQLRCLVRSGRLDADAAEDAFRAEAVLAERRELDDQVERRAEPLSEPREHAFARYDGHRMEGAISCNFRCTCAGSLRRYAPPMADPFRHRLRVRWSECDPQGVVFYANYLDYFDIAMTELWREVVGPFGEMVAGGVDMVVAEARISYRASARFDEELDLVATVVRLGTTSMTTRLAIERLGDGALLTEGELRHVFVDPGTLEKRGIPDDVRRALGRYAAQGVAIA